MKIRQIFKTVFSVGTDAGQTFCSAFVCMCVCVCERERGIECPELWLGEKRRQTEKKRRKLRP